MSAGASIVPTIPIVNTTLPSVDLRASDVQSSSIAWFCVRTQPKHEHIAAAHLRLLGEGDIEIFLPRVRFTRATRRGPVAAVESLFPNYVFARFDWEQYLNLVQYATGVSSVVHFGNHWPTIPDGVVNELRDFFGSESVRHIPSVPDVGDTVLVSRGVFEGLEAVVTRVLPGSQRVAVLLHFLGRQSTVELKVTEINFDARAEVARTVNLDGKANPAAGRSAAKPRSV